MSEEIGESNSTDEIPQSVPADLSKIEKIAELIRRLCVAMLNVEMYPPEHPVSAQSIKLAYEWISNMIEEHQKPVGISMAEGRILFEGLPLEDQNPVVARLSKKLSELHVNNLYFEPGLPADEFESFYHVLSRGSKDINESGGLLELLKGAQLPHIDVKDISFVMVTGDEKVVSKDAQVLDASAFKDISNDEEIVKYMIGEVLKAAGERKWLIQEIKNNPRKMASLITEGIELATSRSDMGLEMQDASIDALLNNIRLVGGSLMNEETGEIKEGEEDLESAVLSLENEVRLRSRKLMSSQVAAGFLNEVLALVTSYSDRVKAKRLSEEFLRDEGGLKRTEKLLRTFVGSHDSTDQLLMRIRDMLKKGGMSDEDLDRMLDLGKKEKPKKPRKPPKTNAELTESLAKRLKKINVNLAPEQLDELTASIATLAEQSAREKVAVVRNQLELTTAELSRREASMDALDIGIMILSPEGNVEYLNSSGAEQVQVKMGDTLRPEIRIALQNLVFPLESIPPVIENGNCTQDEVNLLFAIYRRIDDKGGNTIGAFLIKQQPGTEEPAT